MTKTLLIVIASMLIISGFFIWRISFYLLLIKNELYDIGYYLSQLIEKL